MKCSDCGHTVVEKQAKFCSDCGVKLSTQPATAQVPENHPHPLVTHSETPITDSQQNDQLSENKEATKSQKRPNEEQPIPKKKKKKRKKSKKKKDGSMSPDQEQTQFDSLTSLEDGQEKRVHNLGESSDYSDDAKEEATGSLQTCSPPEDLPSSLAANNAGPSSEDTKLIHKSPGEADESTEMECQEAMETPKEGEISEGKADDNQTLETKPADPSDNKTTKGDGDKATDQKSARKKSKDKKETIMTTQSTLVQSDNPKGKQSRHPKNLNDQQRKGKHLKEEENKDKNQHPLNKKEKNQETEEENQDPLKAKEKDQDDEEQKKKCLERQNKKDQNQNKNQDKQKGNKQHHGESTSKAANEGSSVDPGEMEVEEAGALQRPSDDDKEFKKDGEENSTKEAVSPPTILTKNKIVPAHERVNIYFHAILSKDFKFDPHKDNIFIRAGKLLGTWKENVVELLVTRDLGEHGFLVEGTLAAKKSDIVSESIPYKYVVYRHKKKDYEFEFIYKLDSSKDHTNRCLFVKPRLLTADGDWHQYDDIICAQPTKGMWTRLKEKIFSEQRKDLIQGRMIAGDIMLGTIFDLLSSWSETNLRSFQIQLSQFFQVYGNPFVFEEKGKKWSSLGFGEDNVRMLLKEFMLENVAPQLRDKHVDNCCIGDPLKAAVIVHHVCRQYQIRLDNGELHRLCSALCLPRKEKQDFHEYWTDFSQTIVSVLQSLPRTLVDLIKEVKRKGMLRWILVLPLLHLVKGSIKPFELQVSNTKYGVAWAGLQELEMSNTTLTSQETREVIKMMKDHSHLMEVDSILIRSCLYLMSFEKLTEYTKEMNPELLGILLAVAHKVPQEITGSNFEAATEIISHIQQNLIEEKYSYFTETYRRQCLEIAVKLLEKTCKGVKLGSYLNNFPDVPLACMNLVASVSNFLQCNKLKAQEKDPGVQNFTKDLITQAMGLMRTWMSQSFKTSFHRRILSYFFQDTKADFELWNNVISISFKNEDWTAQWRQTFSLDFEGKYKQESTEDQVTFYCKNIEELGGSNPHVASIVEKCALEAVTTLCQTKCENKLFESFTITWKFWKLISTIIEKSWPRNSQGQYHEDEEVVLRHLLSWATAKDIFQLHGKDEKLFEKLSDDAKERIIQAISTFTAINQQLVEGDIKLNLLSIILHGQKSFLDLQKIDCLSESGQYWNTDKMNRLLDHRQREIKAVHHEKELVDVLLDMSRKIEDHLSVDVVDLEAKVQINIETMPLNSFMEVHHFDEPDTDMTGVVIYFELNDEIREMAEELHTVQESYTFQMLWEKYAKILADNYGEEEDPDEDGMEDKTVTPDVVYDDIFKPCIDEYRTIHASLKNCSITLEEVNQILGAYKGKHNKLSQELRIMSRVDKADDTQWIDTRVEQIVQYHELHLAVASAQVIMKVKETLGLQGDFKVLETLTNIFHADFQREPLSRIDNELMQAKMVLVDITQPRLKCLKELHIRGHFVKWVKDALEDINELKVFVDLASISAGENDMDVDRVACFHDAVLGYSSLLYELKPDSNFHAFKEVLKKLWKALENDKNLPKKLCDSSRHLEWLKTVKDSHGSVELSSLSLASAINQKGIYLINGQRTKKLSLDTALKLQIPEEHEDGHQMRNYSLEDLRELQNKLMLMSGKGDQGQNEVDRFAEVFSSVQRLAEAFIALYTAGNPLFRNWEVTINCCVRGHEPSIIMDFNLHRARSVIVEGSIEEQLPDLCRKMEKCLEYWMNFVDKQRSHHYYLNYYTAEQIVYLCKQLCQQNVNNIEKQCLMMLSFIKPNCTSLDIRQVWHELQYEILTRSHEQNDVEFQTFTAVPTSEKEISGVIDEMNECHVKEARGLEVFDQIWNAYMKNMKEFLPNILDIKSFGKLLEILANKEDFQESDSEEDISVDIPKSFTNRLLPKGLAAGNPNLIICSHNEVLTACISIYMSSADEELPTYDEVLLCNPSTPYEHVELFLRRCLSPGYRGQKIYSLLYGDLLTYEVSSKVENFFQRIKMQSRQDYRLVIICSTEREHAYLPSAFSQYKLHMVPQEPLQNIQMYLQKHYTVSSDQSSAAAVFTDRLCVGVISSKRAGVGKSLYIKRLYEKLKHSEKKSSALKCIRLTEPAVNETVILQDLLDIPAPKELTMFHFDVTSSVQKGLHEFLFKLLILRYLMDAKGKMWRCNDKQLYVIEILEPILNTVKNATRQATTVNSSFTDVFPNIFCRPPKEVLMLEMRKQEDPNIVNPSDPLMDEKEFRSEAFQRPYQYLTRFHNHANLDVFTYQGPEGSHVECLQMLLMFCGIMDPSWAELRNFAWFLNLQLKDCETSVFCDADFTGDTLRGFKTFVVDFMILMAKDFATPSLSISDQSPGRVQVNLDGVTDEDLAPFLIRKRWETEPHPYIFFNDDHNSMTFIGFHLQPNDQNSVDAFDPTSQRVIKRNVMTRELYEGLRLQRVPFNIDFDSLPRWEKIERICNVLGIQWPLDPDETYELTTDNILKMLAIHMRFRCGIPVIIMGETGCGKTRLIKFLCELQKGGVSTENMKLVKVHGGTTSEMIYDKVIEAENIASINQQDFGFNSVLFFDEANTTEAISSIKEVLCDKTAKGEQLMSNSGLHIIAACNPYRKHTDQMIERLESAGLGYRVRAEETDEKLGSIPLRQLVYRVQALPPSMCPLVWDFGQLNDHTEKIYIQQIVQRVIKGKEINQKYFEYITNVLSASQKYMRTRSDECSFVSLRDVERCMQAFVWFYENHRMFFLELQQYEVDQNGEGKQEQFEERDPVLWSIVLATGVCYQACLENKDKYREQISRKLPHPYSPAKILQEISIMQDLLLHGVPMGETIARNNALKENVFMMVLCIELRIPLFLVGKPGSSKSLSKTLVADAMQGQAAHSELYKVLKQVHLVSFQCSPHSTPEGIINTFKQCGRFQEGKNLNEYISVVVLDEIGLAEDSPKMPLKTLHPLLEEGCIDDEPLPHKKVGFIGISNWALDPAKMNRGIFVSRGDPDEKELIESAKGICSSDLMILEKVKDFFKPFAKAYLNICHKQGKGFFGLRDYYSLIKMIFAVAKASQQKPTAEEIVKAVLRNFSGKDDVNAVSVFTSRLNITPDLESINTIEFVRENIQAVAQEEECRYLLVLTKNYAALQILQQIFFSKNNQPEIIFGSSFPKDQEYTQICRNINRVKICMETGQTVVLLNLQNLYESLYDALNQYYVCLGGQKYVDLGLGTHRVKCRVHKDFRLIVIEEREVVYKQFPIPLINRLEKHYLDIHTVLKPEQKRMVKELEKWVNLFATVTSQHGATTYRYHPPDVFIGYHSDTCASVILQVMEEQKDILKVSDSERKLLEKAKLTILKCATPDSVVRLDCVDLPKGECEFLSKVYFEEQNNSCLVDYILADTRQEGRCCSFTEVTTFSRLLTAFDLEPLSKMLHGVELLSLQQFDTEHSFLKKIRSFLNADDRDIGLGTQNKILIIQCDFNEASQGANLLASAKYSSINEINKITQESMKSKVFVYFITRLPRIEGGTSYIGFHGGPWRSVHIDDLRRSKDIVSDIKTLQSMPISRMFETEMLLPEAMDVDEESTEPEPMDMSQSVSNNVVDTTALVRSCVQSAVGMLRDQTESSFRSTQRVAILLTLLSDSDEIKSEFLKTTKKRLHSALVNHDGNALSNFKTNWVLKEASNIDALQEGGTFRQTLWKRVQAVVVPLLAQIISIIDRDLNMDLLLDADCCESVKRLWLDIFSDDKLLELSQLPMDRRPETTTILVQNYIAQNKNTGCSMPFSWRIRDYLEELWVHALQHEGQTQQDFVKFFWKTPLGRYIAAADPNTQLEFYQRYLQDFIFLTMNITRHEDLQLLCSALNCCVSELWLQVNETETVLSLPWVHAAYHQFKNRLQNLLRMTCIEPKVTEDLLGNHAARNNEELILDVYAAFACLEHLEPNVLDTDAQRQAWLRQVKKVQVPIELICAEESVKNYGERSKKFVTRVQSRWNRIFSLSLFVEHMLLGIEELEENLKPLVLEQTRKLGKMLEENSDLKSQQAFESVIRLLKTCKEEVVERLFRFGHSICPVCMGDPQNPLRLPCEHIYCLGCIKQWLSPGQMFCPICLEQVNDDFPLLPSDEISVLVAQHAQFRKQCNAFFIDLVSTVCFKDNSPPCSAVICHLLSFLMVETGTVPYIRANNQIHTKVLSPFDDSVDKNPVVRSVVLKLLLKYSFDDVKEYLRRHLVEVERSNLLDKNDKTELYCMYINCLEDSMFDRSSADKHVILLDEKAFLTDFLQSHRQSGKEATVEYLQQLARVRLDLDTTASLIMEQLRNKGFQGKTQRATEAYLDSMMKLCIQSGNDWYRVYLIRKISSQHGVEFVQKIQKKDQMRWLFPEEVLLKREEAIQIDQYLVYGEDYRTIREAAAKVMLEGKVEGLEEACEGINSSPQQKIVYYLLALYREITTLYRNNNPSFHPKPEQLDALINYIHASKILASPEEKAFAQALVTNNLGPLEVRPRAPGAHRVMEDIAIHLAVVLLCGKNGFLAPLQQLVVTPANMQASYLPTMPEDMVALARQALGPMRLQWYICPNGHPCTIGECGQPMQMSRCVDCGVVIGGQNHAPVQGFQHLQFQGDRTQPGHILGDPTNRDNPDMMDTKGLSSVAFTTLRMITHVSMLLGLCQHPQPISAIIKPPVADPAAFLFEHLDKDLKHLIRSLGKGTDDTICAVHLLISSLLEPQEQKKWPVPYDNRLSSKEARNAWDVEMSNAIITPQLKDLERRLKEVNNFIRSDSRISANPVMTLVFGDPKHFLASLHPNSLIHCSAVWSCRQKVSLLSLKHIVEQNDGKDTLPVLWRFLNREAEIRLVKHLPDILTLQKNLVKKFQNTSELTSDTIEEFLEKQKTGSLKAWYKKHIKTFLTTWNHLRVSLATNGEIKIPADFCQKDLALSSDFKVLLPRRQGPGLCSTALVSYLIAVHNDLIYCVDKHTGEETSFKVSPADLTELHVIHYELERDVMPLVLSNTQYSIQKGQETLHEYDLPKIQQQIISRFLLGKPLLTLNGIPTLMNRHERNYEIIFKDVKGKVKQESLQNLTLASIAGELQSYSEVCEALSTLEVALGFLAMTGGEPHMQLSHYLEEVLQMGNQVAQHILKTLSMCCLKHCVALWQLLASLKSENMLRLKRDPFMGISVCYKQALGADEHRLLTAFFSVCNADTFLLEMHEFMVLVLKTPNATDTYRPDWGLKDTLVSYMERKDLDIPQEVEEHFPEQICLRHSVETWKFIVTFKQERAQRG